VSRFIKFSSKDGGTVSAESAFVGYFFIGPQRNQTQSLSKTKQHAARRGGICCLFVCSLFVASSYRVLLLPALSAIGIGTRNWVRVWVSGL
jgi:hypothetical protein